VKGVLLQDLTWREAEEYLKKVDVCVLPVGGATKEHGFHLPLSTDYDLAEALKKAVVERCEVVMLPTVPYAYYPAFVDWPGSVSIRPTVFCDFVGDIIRSIARFGIKKFLIINMGVSTTGPLDYLSRELHQELGIYVAVTTDLGRSAVAKYREEEAGTHAGEVETAVMLHIRPESVQMDKAEKEIMWRPASVQTGTKEPPGIRLNAKMSRDPNNPFFNRTGVHGDPTLATPEKGRLFFEAMVDEIVWFIEEFRQMKC